MFSASLGGRDAARVGVYRHGLVLLITQLLGLAHTAGGWSPPALTLAALLMGFDAAPTLAPRFESALAVLDRAVPRRRRAGRTYQGLVKALSCRGDALLAALTLRLRQRTAAAAGPRWRVGRFVPIGVDGSRFDAPLTIGRWH